MKRPRRQEQLYDTNMPFVETHKEARNFKLSREVYEGNLYPWKEPIRSVQRPETMAD